MKRLNHLICLLALFMAAIILFPSTAKAAEDVKINATNFPDAVFRKYVSDNFDKNGDDKLSAAEQRAAVTITLDNKGVTSLKGIEYFPNLDYVECHGNNIAEIDISGNPFLVLAYVDTYDYVDMGGGVVLYRYAVFPEDWDDVELDPDPSAFYDLYIDETTKITIGKPVIPEPLKDVKAGLGKKAEFWIRAFGDGTLKYQWQYKKTGGSWTDVKADSGKTYRYSFTAQEHHDGYQYRCRVTNASGDYVLSNIIKLTVVPKPVIKTQPKNVTLKGAGKATIKVVAEGEGLKYNWYVSDPGDTKFFKSSVKTASYSTSLTKEKNGRKAYVIVTDRYGNSVTSKTVTMDYVTAKPKITSPTAATTKKAVKGKTVTFTVKTAIKEKEGKTFQWQYRTSSTGTWKNVAAASGKTASYKLTVAKKHNGYQYRCKVTNPYGSVYSKIFTLKVTS